MKHVSDEYNVFLKEGGQATAAFMDMVMKIDGASALDSKTNELAYIAVLSAVGLTGGLPFHVKSAKKLGATRDEVKSAVLLGLPAVGLAITQALPVVLQSYEEE
ncbi:carboxymuconolactone decarboxylase family protein [Lachnospiraceae bacterium ZAX-1]